VVDQGIFLRGVLGSPLALTSGRCRRFKSRPAVVANRREDVIGKVSRFRASAGE
jgi:hypothetical protein